MARTVERVPIDRMRRPKKPEPKPEPAPKPLTYDEMRRALAALPSPQITVPEPNVTVQAPEVRIPFSPEMQEMLEAARETRDLMAALLASKQEEITIEVTGRDESGAIETFRVTKRETRH